tara:strand:- start:339 stop:1073 length:735 start_codon:yes stop_codon:yes gene_type:complete
MAISVDTVYQKVLALTNKEQRGYITPQEFNLMADRAQMQIFDSYFHDVKSAYHKPSTSINEADELGILEEKLHPHRIRMNFTQNANDNTMTYSSDVVYKINSLIINLADGTTRYVTPVNLEEIQYIENNPLTKATINRPVYVRTTAGGTQNNTVTLTTYPTPTVATTYVLDYFRRPNKPEWGYVVIKKRALYNQNASTDFVLHDSEEENLVSIILKLAGVVIMKPGLVEIGATEIENNKQSQQD